MFKSIVDGWETHQSTSSLDILSSFPLSFFFFFLFFSFRFVSFFPFYLITKLKNRSLQMGRTLNGSTNGSNPKRVCKHPFLFGFAFQTSSHYRFSSWVSSPFSCIFHFISIFYPCFYFILFYFYVLLSFFFLGPFTWFYIFDHQDPLAFLLS